jgi:hypothetical protein
MQGIAAYIKAKVVRFFSGPYASRSYMHQTALFNHVTLTRSNELFATISRVSAAEYVISVSFTCLSFFSFTKNIKLICGQLYSVSV